MNAINTSTTSTPNPFLTSFARVAQNLMGAVLRVLGVAQYRSKEDLLPVNALLFRAETEPRLIAEDTYKNATAEWRAQIARESLQDFSVKEWSKLAIDPRDGALTRVKIDNKGNPTVRGLAYTDHAFTQFINLLWANNTWRPRGGGADAYGALSPYALSVAFDDIRERSRRRRDDEILLRTYTPVINPPGAAPVRRRALRAVVSGRHSGVHFDDLALMQALAAYVKSEDPAVVHRGTNVTHGYAVLASRGGSSVGLEGTLHWRNSETGCAQRAFAAGISIRALDRAVIRDRHVVRVEVDAAIEIESKSTGRNHTLPRQLGGRVLTEEERAAIGQRRFKEQLDETMQRIELLKAQWEKALKSFPKDYIHTSNSAEVVVDMLLEANLLDEDDRAELVNVLNDDKRLAELPRCSAAHLAATYAVMAVRAKSFDAQRRLQLLAGDWLWYGWDKRPASATRGGDL